MSQLSRLVRGKLTRSNRHFAAIAFALVCSTISIAQTANIAGDWQGTLKTGAGPGKRLALHITRHEGDDWTALLISVDRPPCFGCEPKALDGFGTNAFTVQGSDVKFSIDALHVTYAGKLSGDGTTITGNWTDGKPMPLDLQRATKDTAWIQRPSEKISFIDVDKGVRLEVVDWGGSGRPLVLLPGLGNTAHIFDSFAPKLTAHNHVVGITTRGFGESSVPAATGENYSADRLADDVLAVTTTLDLNRPVLAGHSIAGEILSSVGSRYPEKVAGLIYLEAGFSQSLYDPATGDPQIDTNTVQRQLDQLAIPGGTPEQRKYIVHELLQTSLPQLEKNLREDNKNLASAPELAPGATASWRPSPPWSPAAQAILQGEQKFTDIKCPVLAIFSSPHQLPPNADDAAKAKDLADTTAHANLFQTRIPGATIIRIPKGTHYIFLTSEADVLAAGRRCGEGVA